MMAIADLADSCEMKADRAPAGRRTGELVFRALGSAWFLLLAVMVARNWHGGGNDGFAAWSQALSQCALVLVYLTLWLLILLRPAPIARANGMMPNVMAFVGTYMPWLIGFMPRPDLPAFVQLLATTFIVAGNIAILIVVWYLGRSFSLVPQARRLVTSGSYRIVRHPLYLAEELMIVGSALLYLSSMTVLLVVLHFAIQMRRMFYEEAVLQQAFPAYSSYKRSSLRVIPYVW